METSPLLYSTNPSPCSLYFILTRFLKSSLLDTLFLSCNYIPFIRYALFFFHLKSQPINWPSNQATNQQNTQQIKPFLAPHSQPASVILLNCVLFSNYLHFFTFHSFFYLLGFDFSLHHFNKIKFIVKQILALAWSTWGGLWSTNHMAKLSVLEGKKFGFLWP